MLGTQTASIFMLRYAENAESNVPKWIRSEAKTLHTFFETERYFDKHYNDRLRDLGIIKDTFAKGGVLQRFQNMS